MAAHMGVESQSMNRSVEENSKGGCCTSRLGQRTRRAKPTKLPTILGVRSTQSMERNYQPSEGRVS